MPQQSTEIISEQAGGHMFASCTRFWRWVFRAVQHTVTWQSLLYSHRFSELAANSIKWNWKPILACNISVLKRVPGSTILDMLEWMKMTDQCIQAGKATIISCWYLKRAYILRSLIITQDKESKDITPTNHLKERHRMGVVVNNQPWKEKVGPW